MGRAAEGTPPGKYKDYASGIFRHHKRYGPLVANKNVYIEGFMNYRNNLHLYFDPTKTSNIAGGLLTLVAFPTLIWNVALTGSTERDMARGMHHDYAFSSRNRSSDPNPPVWNQDPTERRAKEAERKAALAEKAIEHFRKFEATSEVKKFQDDWLQLSAGMTADQMDEAWSKIARRPTPMALGRHSMQKNRMDRAIMEAELAKHPLIPIHDLRLKESDLPDWWGDKEKRAVFEEFWEKFTAATPTEGASISYFQARNRDLVINDKKYDFVKATLNEKLPGWWDFPNMRLPADWHLHNIKKEPYSPDLSIKL